MKYARINNSKVVELVETESLLTSFHESLIKDFVPAFPEVMAGWEYANGAFFPPIPRTQTREEAIAIGNKYVESFFPDHIQKLMLAMATFGTDSQKAKLSKIYEWIFGLLQTAQSNYSTFEPTRDGGLPPYDWSNLL